MEQKKIIIFDFDGTFYSGKHKFDLVEQKINENRRKFLPFLSDEQYNIVVKENPNWLKCVAGCDIAECIYNLKKKYPTFKISVQNFVEWQEQNLYDIILDNNHIVSSEFIKSVCQSFPTYIVSNSSQNHLSFYLDKIGMKRDWFKKIISNQFLEFDKTKEHYYKQILQDENCRANEVYVFGDSFDSDLLPAKNLGMNICLIDDANSLYSKFDINKKTVL